MREHGAHGAERRVDIEIEHAIPLVRIALSDRPAYIGSGIGVENVDLARLRQDSWHHGPGALRIG
ncbi:hypothetical protein D3C86_2151580 [compost metagenome]